MVRRNENDEEIKIILDDHKIIIELSPEIYTTYFKFKNQFQLINFSLVYPALRYALLKLNENKDSNWAHTISNVIEQKTDFDPEKINDDNVDKVFSSLMKGYTGKCFLEVEQWKR